MKLLIGLLLPSLFLSRLKPLLGYTLSPLKLLSFLRGLWHNLDVAWLALSTEAHHRPARWWWQKEWIGPIVVRF
ncbi:hypothetical protein BV511_22970 [Methylorubrum extorquens]|nr:hypothetical protein BV511_22970 [Methylorubrum extorquens]